MKALVLVHTATTLILVGLIWTIQIVHYPLFNKVGERTYAAYQAAHMNRITLLVLPIMFVEIITAFALALMPIDGIPPLLTWAGLGVLLLIWGITGLVNAPQHTALVQGFDTTLHHALLVTNWVRTILWTARGSIVMGMIWLLIH